jgi:membrane-associated phospholipid phosphatase
MTFLTQHGVDWIVAIQSLGSWLELPMRFFSLFHAEYFFLLVVPLLHWSVDTKSGLRIAFLFATSEYLNAILKLWFAGPRPYWVSDRVQYLQAEGPSGEGSFGIPSGHAQEAAALGGALAAWVFAGKRLVWIAVFLLTFLIGFSRLYLGVHFVHDVLAGWLIGFAILFAFVRFWDPIAAWLKTKPLAQQVLIPFVISLTMIAVGGWSAARLSGYVLPVEWMNNIVRVGPLPDPVSIDNIVRSAGSLFGLAAGAAWISSQGGYQASGSIEKRALRYLIGMIGIVILWEGLEKVFPRDETLLSLILLYVRHSLVGFWLTAGAPWLFFHFKLADKPGQRRAGSGLQMSQLP